MIDEVPGRRRAESATMTEGILNERFRITRELGQGGMGKVYLVEDQGRDGQLMALKTMLSKDVDETFLEAFRLEFAELAKLRHRNVAAAYDFGKIASTGEHFFTTEFIDGVDLMRGTRGVSFDLLLDVTAQLLKGLDFLHRSGLLHNDLKPANVLLGNGEERRGRGRGNLSRLESTVYGRAGEVKIIDFGLVSGMNLAWERPRGTPRYMSPERILCHPADGRADLYSLGCMLFLLAARQPPFQEKDTRELLKQHLHCPPPLLSAAQPSIPQGYAHFVARLLEKKPEDRFPDSAAALKSLEAAFGQSAPVEVRAARPEIEVGALFARGEELEKLEARLAEVFSLRGACRCVRVTGRAGVGKSRLVEEIKGKIQVRSGAFVEVAGSAVERHLGPLLDAVVAGLRMCGAEDVDASVEQAIGTLDTRRPGAEIADGLERLLLHHARQRPLILHLDDFQNASKTVRLFAVGLANAVLDLDRDTAADQSLPRLLLVVSRRSECDGADLELEGVDTISLSPFESDDARQFVCRAFGQDDIPTRVLDALVSASSGNARFLLELSRTLVENGHVSTTGTSWAFPDSLETVPLPRSIRDSMDHRIGLLGNDARSVLEWLGAASAPLGLVGLRHCTQFEERKIELVVDKLVQAGFVSAVDEDDTTFYEIAYPDLRAGLVDGVDEKRRAFLHQRLGQAAESIGAVLVRSPGERAEFLAHHWLASGNHPAFLRFAPEAAAHLHRGGNFAKAVAYHQRIAESLPDEAAAKKIQSFVKLSEMHEFLWKLEASEADLGVVLTLGKELLRPSDKHALRRRLLQLALGRNDLAVARKYLRAVKKGLTDDQPPLERLAIRAPEAWVRWLQGDSARAREGLEIARDLLAACAPTNPKEKGLAISGRNWIASLHHQWWDLEEAESLHRENLAALEGLDMAQAEASCLCSLGGVLLDQSRPGDAVEALESALATAKSIGDRRTLCRTRERLGEYHFLYGKLKTALQVTQVGLEDAESIGHAVASASLLRLLGRIHGRAGQIDEAVSVLKRAAALHRGHNDCHGAPFTRLELARAHLFAEAFDLAKSHADQALEVAQKHGLRWILVRHASLSLEIELRQTGRIAPDGFHDLNSLLGDAPPARERIAAVLLRARSALGAGEGIVAHEAIESIETDLEKHGTSEQKMRAEFIRAAADLLGGDYNRTVPQIRRVKKHATDAVFPSIADDCAQLILALREDPQVSPTVLAAKTRSSSMSGAASGSAGSASKKTSRMSTRPPLDATRRT